MVKAEDIYRRKWSEKRGDTEGERRKEKGLKEGVSDGCREWEN
jgi:hypothetical protein